MPHTFHAHLNLTKEPQGGSVSKLEHVTFGKGFCQVGRIANSSDQDWVDGTAENFYLQTLRKGDGETRSKIV